MPGGYDRECGLFAVPVQAQYAAAAFVGEDIVDESLMDQLGLGLSALACRLPPKETRQPARATTATFLKGLIVFLLDDINIPLKAAARYGQRGPTRINTAKCCSGQLSVDRWLK
jgi:hypothetical protein